MQTTIDKLRYRFHGLSDARQTIVISLLILVTLGISACLISLGIRQLLGSRATSRQNHDNVEYVMLQNVDEEDENNNNNNQTNHRPTPLTANGHRKYDISTDMNGSPNQIGDRWREEKS